VSARPAAPRRIALFSATLAAVSVARFGLPMEAAMAQITLKSALGVLVFAASMIAIPAVAGEQGAYPFKPNPDNLDLLAYWYPVPADSVVMQHSGKTWEFSSMLHVYGAAPEGPFEVTVEARRDKTLLFRRTYNIVDKKPAGGDFTYSEANGYFRIEAKTDYRPERPTEIAVAVSGGKTRRARTVPCQYRTIKGTIRDINDKPFRAFLSVGPDQFSSPVTVWSDSQGRFSIDLPERTYNTFYADDQTYRVSTLEMWGWHMIVDRDETFDFTVGNGEVYNLHAWANNGGYGTYFVYFRPMVLPLLEQPLGKTVLNGQEFRVIDITPRLKPDEVTVRINGAKADLVSLQEVYETGTLNNAPSAMPAYLVQVRRGNLPPNGKITLSVEYDTKVTVNDRPVRVRSVGYTQFYNLFSGLSFYY